MQDIQVIRILDALQVNRVEEAPGVEPRSVIVTGQDFSSVEQVLLNGFPSPEFVQYSESRIVAQVPEIIEEATITEVMVLSSRFTLTPQSLVEFTLGERIRAVTGTQKLMQNFIRILLRSPGTNLFHPRSGGGLTDSVGNNLDSKDRVSADIAVSVSRTRQYIVGTQTPNRSIPDSERLLSADITGLDVDPVNSAVYLTVLLRSHSGSSAAASLVA